MQQWHLNVLLELGLFRKQEALQLQIEVNYEILVQKERCVVAKTFWLIMQLSAKMLIEKYISFTALYENNNNVI